MLTHMRLLLLFCSAAAIAAGAAGIQVWYETQPPGELDPVIDVMSPRGRIIVMAGRKAKPA